MDGDHPSTPIDRLGSQPPLQLEWKLQLFNQIFLHIVGVAMAISIVSTILTWWRWPPPVFGVKIRPIFFISNHLRSRKNI